jgi:nicotinate-nucleotide adenylyltransferase
MTLRLGVMGGMFDPVHCGHLQAAELARDRLALSRVFLVPCATPNHRAQPGASQADRLAMLQLAVRDFPGLHADDREYHRPGVSYMIDTLNSFREEFPLAVLVYIMGYDSFLSLPGWNRWREIFGLCHLCVISRAAEQDQSVDPSLREVMASRLVSDPAGLDKAGSGLICMLSELELPHASSRIREQLSQGLLSRAANAELPPAVAGYIEQHHLYRSH